VLRRRLLPAVFAGLPLHWDMQNVYLGPLSMKDTGARWVLGSLDDPTGGQQLSNCCLSARPASNVRLMYVRTMLSVEVADQVKCCCQIDV
jgi:hypothetical protein